MCSILFYGMIDMFRHVWDVFGTMIEPDPNDLLAAADDEPKKIRGLRAYRPVIRKLKNEKDFTFREIAEWLKERGLDIDHNAVYRQYTAGMPEQAALGAQYMDDEQEERNEITEILDEEP